MSTIEATDQVTAAVAGLRELADFIEQHPDLPWGSSLAADLTISVQVNFLDDFTAVEALALFARSGGTWEKRPDGQYYNLVRSFGPISIEAWANRAEVCERVVVGTEVVEVPDPDALKAATESVPKVTVEKEIVEWQCHPLLADSERGEVRA